MLRVSHKILLLSKGADVSLACLAPVVLFLKSFSHKKNGRDITTFCDVFAVLICAFYSPVFDLSSGQGEVYKTQEAFWVES